MQTAFGPQGPNYSTVRPAADSKVSASDTWFKNCSVAGAKDGTYATADFFNVIIANLREAVRRADIALDDASDTMLFEAIQAIAIEKAEALVKTYTASRGLRLSGNDFRSTLGDGSRPLLTV